LRNPANKQTNKQTDRQTTNASENITSLAEWKNAGQLANWSDLVR